MSGATPTPPRTPAELRRFGLTVGGVFSLLAAISWWRGHVLPPQIMGAVGVALIVPALLAPGALGPVERGWMAFAAVLGAVNTRILLTLVYVAVVTPIGLLRRLRDDPLGRRAEPGTTTLWIKRSREAADPATYRKQF